jgi:glycosyltransferase involved in cell wall biosynthesis
LALTALLVAHCEKIPVILDMAENYPAMLDDRREFGSRSIVGSVIRNPRIAKIVERIAIKGVDHVIVVIEESLYRLQRSGVSESRLSMIGNTPRLDRWPVADRSQSVKSRPGMELIYLGNLDGSRGVDVAIRALREAKNKGWTVTMTVVGDGPSIEDLRALALSLKLEEQVKIVGRLPLQTLLPIMERADVGIIPHYVTDAWNTTMPNKLFDYMALGKPVIVSNARPVARIVMAEKCGLVFSDRDPKSFANAIISLSDQSVRHILGKRGRNAVLRKYNWTNDETRLLDTIENVKTTRAVACAESLA